MHISKRGLDDVLANEASRQALAIRFWSKVSRSGDSQCWIWTAKAKHKFGYGAIVVCTGCVQTSHRVAWALENGPIPDGAFITHDCDVPACCNPKHLRLGDARSNANEKVARGRQSRVQHSPELIEQIQSKRRGKPQRLLPEVRAKKAEKMRERWKDPEWRQKFSEMTSGENNHRFGKRPPDHQIEAVRRAHRRGFKHTEETKTKMRAAALARLTT